MYVAVILAWAATLAWFDPKLARLYRDAPRLDQSLTITAFIVLLNVFWLFGTYYLLLSIFSLISRAISRGQQLGPAPPGRVAILYLTRNDFDAAAAKSCAEQTHPGCRLFILDDSTRADMMDKVDCFCRSRGPEISVIRREGRRGFKAGSINNALRQIQCDYFAIVDADGVLPPDFVSSLLPHFSLDPAIAFVHGGNRPNPRQKSNFAADLALGIVPLWTTYFGPRNRFGFVPFLGHGAILRKDVWKAIGGIPEIVSEDLAFSTKAAELGYVGYFADNVTSLEDFPSTYAQLRKQQEKYIKGGCEFIHRFLGSFLRSGRVRWFEKLDVVLSCSTLFLPLMHAVFLVVFGILLTHAIGEERALGFRLGSVNLTLWKAHLLKENFNSLWTWDFYLLTLLNMFAPILGCANLVITSPRRLVRLLFLSSVPYLSLMVVCFFGVLTYLITRRASFLVTADQDDSANLYTSSSERPRMAFVESLNSGHWLVHAVELASGAAFSIFSIWNLNIVFFGFSLSLLMGSVLVKSCWNKRVKFAVSFPFVLIMAGMGLLGGNLLSAQGVFCPLLLFHF